MIAARSKHAAVAFDGCILVVGGSCGNRNYVDSVEVFSLPHNHRPMGQWTVLTSRTSMGQCISLVVWQDRLFAFCSKDDSSNSIREFVPPASQSAPSRKKFDNWLWAPLGRVDELDILRGAVLLHQL
ncbi:unnamed protein product [Schistocephalus solidus]|uniref:Kelch-like protein 18 n=1 Tax=Schistocephalus solidus TaxID=70667 RepID=A0A183TSY3_SCHSO|nr:unnamed protein product [Schistocephalus solidus]